MQPLSISILSSILIFSSVAVAADQASTPTSLKTYACTKIEPGKGLSLDLTGAKLTFEDQFDKPSIGLDHTASKWFTGLHGSFGGSKFMPDSPTEGPFITKNGELTIRLEKLQKGHWHSGLIQSMDSSGQGFSQTYGYFELRAKFPTERGVWPAFWLKTANEFTDPTQTRAEIDVIEAYGGDPKGFHTTVHLWPAAQRLPTAPIQKHWSSGCYRKIPDKVLDGQFHLYGAQTTPDWVIIYFDRKEIARFPSLPEFRKPLFILIDLALNQKETRPTDAPSEMILDYVRVWDLKK